MYLFYQHNYTAYTFSMGVLVCGGEISVHKNTIFCPLHYYYLHSKHHSYCVWITHKNNLERDVFLQIISMKIIMILERE